MNLQLVPFPVATTTNPDAYLLVDEDNGLTMGLIVRLACMAMNNEKPVPGWTISQIQNRDTEEQNFIEMKDRSGKYLVAETPEKAIIEFVAWYIDKL